MTEKEKHDTREQLLESALRVFAKRGYDGATVKELAEEAGANVSLISYYFNGKEGLYRACLEHFGKGRLETAKRVLKPAETAEEFKVRLSLFVEEFVEAHMNQQEFCTIMHRECTAGSPFFRELFQGVFMEMFETLIGYFKDAQKRGLVRGDLDAMITVSTFFGGLAHTMHLDFMVAEVFKKSLKDKNHRKNFIHNVVRNLTEGVLA